MIKKQGAREEWEDVTGELKCKLGCYYEEHFIGYYIKLFHGDNEIACTEGISGRVELSLHGHEEETYKLVIDGGYFKIFRKKRKDSVA